MCSYFSLREHSFEGRVGNPGLYLRGTAYIQFELHVDQVTLGNETYPIQGGVIVRWSEPQFPVHTMQHVRVTGQLDTILSRVDPDTTGVEDARRRRRIHSEVRLRGEMADRLSRAVPESILPFVLTV